MAGIPLVGQVVRAAADPREACRAFDSGDVDPVVASGAEPTSAGRRPLA
ncbi:hypothetical protein ACQPZ2_40755 [Nocardia pseudovaccinii]